MRHAMRERANCMRVPVEHEHFIPVSKHRVREVLADALFDGAQRNQFLELCQLIGALFHFEYQQLVDQLKEDFTVLEAAAQNGSNSVDEQELAQREQRFLKGFCHVMMRANFRMVSQEDIDVAEAVEYLFTLPVKINWDKLDDQMLRRYFETHGYGVDPEEGESQPGAARRPVEAPEFAHRILLFRRGTGVDQATGWFLLEKLDLIVSWILIGLWRAVWWLSRPWRWFCADHVAPRDASAGTDRPADDDREKSPNEESPSAGTSPERSCIFKQQWIERITLREVLQKNPFALLTRSRLQEPTFRELVILFRFASQPGQPKERKIHIKLFRDIPMADLEVVFPEKRVSMQPLDLVKLTITGAVGFVVLVVKFAFQAVSVLLNPAAMAAMLVMVVGYASKVFVGFQSSKARYQHVLTQSLYHKNQDNDFGVVHYLVDALEEQEFKEAAIAYALLHRAGPAGLTERELDEQAEQFLSEQFDGLEVDFEVDDALKKLLRFQIVRQQNGRYVAEPLPVALERLDHQWDNFFKYNQQLD